MTPETCCCGCCTVAKGTLIIGICNVIGGIFVVIGSVVPVALRIYISLCQPDLTNYPYGLREYNTADTIIVLAQLFFALLHLIVSSLMVHGWRTRNHRLIMPWIIWSYVALVLLSARVIFLFLDLLGDGYLAAGIFSLAISPLYFLLQGYFVFVVKRFVDQLKMKISY
ncbi:uncharacterized protein LOC118437463 [Folsomia candida]|uniref:uncharacterized protein LOC118437463 n=1 Tax=Folsomia candida TaxID=158441 RepID=UPI00160546F7|nr:uncharacterized protein LOC118437463 [Folsomia candida]